MSELANVHHLALTVTDVDRSVPWYTRVLGLEELTRREDEATGLRKVVLRAPSGGIAVVLVQHSDTERPGFDERHTGLDHVAFQLDSVDDLQKWERHLVEHGVTHTPAAPSRTMPGSLVVVFRDPDGIQLEVWANPTP